MELTAEADLPRPAAPVWAVMMDVQKLAGCIPGCESVTELVALSTYKAVMKQKLGPFKLEVPAEIRVEELREPDLVRARATGRDKFTGTRLDVLLSVALLSTGLESCRLTISADMQVAGKLASLGYPIIKKKAAENFAEFQNRLLAALAEA